MCSKQNLTILWFSNYRFTGESIKTTGTWLKVMGESLSKHENIRLINISFSNKNEFSFETVNGIDQYLVPSRFNSVNSLLNTDLIIKIDRIIDKIKPNIIHVWGTESFWGLIAGKYVDNVKVLLEMQGVLIQIKQHFFGGMSFFDVLRCTGPKELLKFKTHLLYQYKTYSLKSTIEESLIKANKYISVQSDWTCKIVNSINPQAKIFNSLIPLRVEFIKAKDTWNSSKSGRIFTSLATLHSFKGLHVAIQSVAVLRQNGIDATINIAGAYSHGLRKSGYQRYLHALIKKYKLEEHVFWLGALDADELVCEFQRASAIIIPSYVESYCVSLYEALCIGTPVVCSFAGAMTESSRLGPNVKYFQPGDFISAAFLLKGYLTNSTKKTFFINNVVSPNIATERQLSIYHELLSI
jgi:glycosyltransferase involved in cell wall biosynthesis